MPKLKQRTTPYDDLLRLLKAYGLGTSRKLAEAIYCSDYTGRARLKNPGDLTFDELRNICRNGGVPAAELREALKFS